MPLIVILIGLVIATAAVRNTHRELGELLGDQFAGERSFIVWLIAIGAIGVLGSYEPLKPLARAFLVLVLLVMVLTNSREEDLLTLFQSQILVRNAAKGMIK